MSEQAVKTNTSTPENCIQAPELFDADDLFDVLRNLDAMRYLLQDMQEDYFDQYTPGAPNENNGIIWDFRRNAARLYAVEAMLQDAIGELEALGVKR